MKIRRISAVILMFTIISNISVFGEYVKPTGLWYANITRNTAVIPGAVSKTPDKWKFEYEGQEFVLLDTFNDGGKMKFFIMTEGLYGTHKYSTATKEPYGWFNPEDENNIAYWLNNDFWNNGNGGMELPSEMKNYITENVWVTEPLRDDAGSGHVPEGYKSTSIPPKTTCKLALLSDWEWKAYIDKIGFPGATWFFRSARTVDLKTSTSAILCGINAVGYNNTVTANGEARGVRPVFMLDSDFFYNCKLTNVGGEVAKIIDSYCNPDLYTDEERKNAFGWPDAIVTGIDGNAVIGQELEVMYDYYGTFAESGTEFKWYRSDNISSGYVQISGANKKTYKITEADDDKYIKAEVLPKSKSVMSPVGYPVESSPVGPVFGTSKVNKAIEEVRNASVEEVMSVLEKYNAVFMVDTYLGDMTENEKENIALIFTNADFDTIEELRDEYDRAVALAKLNANDDVAYTSEYIVESMHLDLSRYDALKNRDDVHKAVTGKNYTKFADFEKDFYEAVCVTDISGSDRNNIKSVLLSHRHIFTADFMKLTEYQLELVGTDVLSGKYEAFSALDKTVSEAVSQALKVEVDDDSPMISDNLEIRDENKPSGFGFVPIIPKSEVFSAAVQGNYTDLDDAPWAKESIEELSKKGIVSGYGDGAFCPNATLTREEFVKIIVGAFYPDSKGFKTASVFEDVKPEKWYSMYINIAYENGVITGVSDKEFGVGKNITREDMAVILCRVIDIDTQDTVCEFADADEISEYARGAVSALVSAKFISGYENGKFSPKTPATRAMAAKVIYDILKSDDKI